MSGEYIPDEGEVPCDECHGAGEFECAQGCHTQPCGKCESTGYIDPGEIGI